MSDLLFFTVMMLFFVGFVFRRNIISVISTGISSYAAEHKCCQGNSLALQVVDESSNLSSGAARGALKLRSDRFGFCVYSCPSSFNTFYNIKASELSGSNDNTTPETSPYDDPKDLA